MRMGGRARLGIPEIPAICGMQNGPGESRLSWKNKPSERVQNPTNGRVKRNDQGLDSRNFVGNIAGWWRRLLLLLFRACASRHVSSTYAARKETCVRGAACLPG